MPWYPSSSRITSVVAEDTSKHAIAEVGGSNLADGRLHLVVLHRDLPRLEVDVSRRASVAERGQEDTALENEARPVGASRKSAQERLEEIQDE